MLNMNVFFNQKYKVRKLGNYAGRVTFMMGAGSVRRLNCSLSDISKPDCSHSLDDQSRTDLLRDLICILEIVPT